MNALNNRRARPTALIALLASCATLAGCAVGPDFHTPAAPRVEGYAPAPLPEQTATADVAGGAPQRFVQGLDIPGQWWTAFHSPSLDALIARALAANPDLQAAQAALRAAQEAARAQAGDYFPAIDGNVQSNRQMVGRNISSPLQSGSSLFTLHTAQLEIAYKLDAFGGVRRQVEALEAQAEAQRFQLEAAYLTLTSNVAASAIHEASLRAQIAATRKIVSIGSDVLDLMRRQAALGAIAPADVIAQETLVAQAGAALPPLEKQLAQERNRLVALTGSFPSDELSERFELAELQLPGDVPVSLPSQLVEQRPDIRAATAQLHAATAQLGVATADMLPQLTLSAAVGSSAIDTARLFSAGTRFWSLVGGLTQPIFHGGTLLHRKRAAEANLEQAAAQYQSTVVTAFQNVADSLRALQYDAEALKAQRAAEGAAAQSLAIARGALQLGATSYLSVLNAEQAYQQAVIGVAQVQGDRYADTVALFQALGGGWWNRADVAGERVDVAARTGP